MTTINNQSIEDINNSLTSYEVDIGLAQIATITPEVDYSGKIYPKFADVKTKKDDISTFLQGLTFTQMPTSDDITSLDISYNKFHGDLLHSNIINENLKNIAVKYKINEAQLENSKRTKTYATLMVWIIIFMFVGSALFMSIIEDKKQMNIFSKIILVLFLLIVVFYVVKNLLTYIK